MPEWLSIAMYPRVVRRGLRYAAVVGAILLAINHGDAILRGDIPLSRALRMLLTVMVPYCVATLSSVEAIRETRRRMLANEDVLAPGVGRT